MTGKDPEKHIFMIAMNYTSPDVMLTMQDHIANHVANGTVYRIRWMGQFFKTRKGKTSWKKEGLARSAFNTHLCNSMVLYEVHAKHRTQDPTKDHWQNQPTAEDRKEFIRQQEAAGLLQIVRV